LDVSLAASATVARRRTAGDATAALGRKATTGGWNLGDTGRKAVDTAADKNAAMMLEANLIMPSVQNEWFLQRCEPETRKRTIDLTHFPVEDEN
jgi:hypothetical protein